MPDPITPPVQELILESIKARLSAINSTLSPDLYHTQVRRVVRGIIPPDEADGIVLMLNAPKDTPDTRMPEGGRATGGPPEGTQTCILDVTVEAWINHEFMSDTMHVKAAADIVRQVLSDRYQGGYAKNSWWVETSRVLQNVTAPVGILTVRFQVQYRTRFGKQSEQL